MTKKQVAIKIVLPTPSLTPSLVEAVGEAQALSDLRALLGAVPEMPYEVEVEDGSSVSVVPELSIPGTPIEIEVESLRNLVRERGVFLNGHPCKTESYDADPLLILYFEESSGCDPSSRWGLILANRRALGMAPTKRSTGWPFLNKIKVGMLMIP